MDLLGKSKNFGGVSDGVEADGTLYRALAAGDLPAAYLAGKDIKVKSGTTAFNYGLCLFRLGEWEKALAELKHAEQDIGNPPEYEISERKLFLKALESSEGATALLPLDPSAPQKFGRYALVRVRWLTALCLKNLGRESEAAPVIRFLSQYDIQI